MACRIEAEEIIEQLRLPQPVGCTAIYSRSDGILAWSSCHVDGPDTENVAVPSSHVGLVSNPLVLAALTDRLARLDAEHLPFSWSTCLRSMLTAEPSPAGNGRRWGIGLSG
jgi:hypothetical protein